MNLISLPKNLKLSFPYEDREMDLSNWTALAIYNEAKLEIETKDGKIKPRSAKRLFKYLTRYTTVFTYYHPGKVDSLFSLLTRDELMELAIYGKTEVESYYVRRYSNCVVINYTPIYNLIDFTKDYFGDDFECVNRVAEIVLRSRESVGIPIRNLGGGACEARGLMLQDELIKDDILLSRILGRGTIDKFNAACYGGRMESSGLGTTWQYSYDLIKSHLNILKDYPGIRDTTWLRGMPYADSALPHSIYLITTNIERKYKFNPLPKRIEDKLCYPNGIISGWYYKDYVDLLSWLKIPFKILDSVQFIGEGTYPFRDLVGYIKGVCKIFEADYPELEAKHLYATLAGSTKSIYRNLGDELQEIQTAARCFNPIIYGFVLSRQNTIIYKDAVKTAADSIKMDSIGCKNKIETDGLYSLKDYGISTYITPALKTLPHNERDIYRRALILSQDLGYITIEVRSWNGLDTAMSDRVLNQAPDVGLGEAYRKLYKIKPNHGAREGTYISRVGDLLHFWFTSSPSDKTVVEEYGLLKLRGVKRKFG